MISLSISSTSLDDRSMLELPMEGTLFSSIMESHEDSEVDLHQENRLTAVVPKQLISKYFIYQRAF